ncbi:hypothetical protein PQX77_018886 [Marasmius sp. AFHP31]|nr:hypothetical protein PQX77_018886 [Marasmius sp. AFHP31]
MSTPQLPRDDTYHEVMKSAFTKFRVAERHYLLTLPNDLKLHLQPSPFSPTPTTPVVPHWYYAAHLSYHCELLFTLGGLKPCVLFAHGSSGAVQFIDDLIRTCLNPILEEFNILAYGFLLSRISHDTPTTTHGGFKNGWVLADLRNPQYPLVERVFLRHYTENGGRIPEVDVGTALGYPTVRGTHWVEYLDETEREELARVAQVQVPGICCVTAMEYTCDEDPENPQKVIAHFRQCAKLMQMVGRTLKLGEP